ncbi:MAG TPA: SRPBCC family protein [Kofleriaceae bacterium]
MKITKQLIVEAPIEKAFRVFTQKMSTWWPKVHHIGTSPLKDAVVEPKVDGRWYEVGEDGSECDWGRVLEWDPPNRLVLNWQLNFEYKFDPTLRSEVEVKFTALSPTRTQVDFEHRDLDKLGKSPTAVNDMDRGWAMILDLFVTAAAS